MFLNYGSDRKYIRRDVDLPIMLMMIILLTTAAAIATVPKVFVTALMFDDAGKCFLNTDDLNLILWIELYAERATSYLFYQVIAENALPFVVYGLLLILVGSHAAYIVVNYWLKPKNIIGPESDHYNTVSILLEPKRLFRFAVISSALIGLAWLASDISAQIITKYDIRQELHYNVLKDQYGEELEGIEFNSSGKTKPSFNQCMFNDNIVIVDGESYIED